MLPIKNRIKKKKILTVCTGNICRSPTAEVVLRKMLDEQGISHQYELDSAGTQGVSLAGRSPDKTAIAVAAKRGYNLTALRARQFELTDFDQFDLILAMDKQNHNSISYLKPMVSRAEVRLFMSYVPSFENSDVPDPYRKRSSVFENTLDLIELGASALVEALVKSR